MGFDTKLVQSEESHYATFICTICQQVADLDALVTSKCSHPFCKSCLESWIPRSSSCPTCDIPIVGIKYGDGIPCTTCRQQEGEIYPLSESQPLAFQSMSRIQVRCPHCLTWDGDYSKLAEHEETCRHKQQQQQNRPRRSRRASNESPAYNPESYPRRATMDHHATSVSSSSGATNGPAKSSESSNSTGGGGGGMYNDSVDDDDLYPSRTSYSQSSSESSSRHASSRRRVSNEREMVRPLSTSGDPIDENGGSRHRHKRNGSSDRQPESIPEDEIAAYHDGGGGGRRSRSGARSPVRHIPSSRMGTEPDENYSEEYQNNNNNNSTAPTGANDDLNDSMTGSSASNGKRVVKGRKPRQRDISSTANVLKEKANARFNKGDLAEATNLYTQALNLFPDIRAASADEKQVIATLYCNRGATSFRGKDHDGCIQDCESAIQLVPDYAKVCLWYMFVWGSLSPLFVFWWSSAVVGACVCVCVCVGTKRVPTLSLFRLTHLHPPPPPILPHQTK